MSTSYIFTTVKIIVFNASNNVFSQSYVSTYFKTFKTIIKFSGLHVAIISIISSVKIGQCRHIIVVSIYAPAANFGSFSAFVCQTYYITVIIHAIIVISIAIHIFTGEFQVFSYRESNTYIVDFIFVKIIYIVVRSISINNAKFSSYISNIKTVFGKISEVATVSFTNITGNFYFVAISKFQTIYFSIKYIAGMRFEVLTTCIYFNTANTAGYISPVQINIVIAFGIRIISPITFIVLIVFKTAGVSPVFVNLTIQEQTGTQTTGIFAFIVVTIRQTNLTGNFYIVSFFLKVSYAYTKAVQFVSKFSC